MNSTDDHAHMPPTALPVDESDAESSESRVMAFATIRDENRLQNNQLSRVWQMLPDWFFQLAGIVFFLWYLFDNLDFYLKSGDFVQSLHLPFLGAKIPFLKPQILVDITYLLIVAGFCFRVRPIRRTTDVKLIFVAMCGAFWPFLPFIIRWSLTDVVGGAAGQWWIEFMGFESAKSTQPDVAIGMLLLLIGLLIEIWGYAYLVRSLSIVPEARVLKVTGPYRLIRHPIYFGQFLAQIAVWLLIARWHVVWVFFVGVFIAFQLIRARWEDRVLENAFGEPYRQWKAKTYWFA